MSEEKKEWFIGSFEFHDDASDSHKFYQIIDHRDGAFSTRWGRIGTKGQRGKIITRSMAMRKCNKKLDKGYERVEEDNFIDDLKRIEDAVSGDEYNSGFNFMEELRNL